MKFARQFAFLAATVGLFALPLCAQQLGAPPTQYDPYGGGFVQGWAPGDPLFPVYIDTTGGMAGPPNYDPYGPSSSLGTPPPYGTVAPPTMAPPPNPNPYAPPPAGYDPNAYPAYNGSNAWAASAGNSFYDPSRTWEQYWSEQPIKLVEGPRLRYTFLGGSSSDNDLQINDFDTSVVFNWPNFLWTRQPLHIAPSFSLHLWDGPKNIAADLPPRAYSGFFDLGWESPIEAKFGGEVGVRGGVFADFSKVTTDSWRLMGKGLFRWRVGEKMTLRGGVYYLDRVKVKLLPAGGFTWTPNPLTRFDVFFPYPKLSQYLTTSGSADVWWYLAAEYGGGSWTVRRTSGDNEQMDINDYRVMLGIEWGSPPLLRAGRRFGFFEAGWVFDRQLAYRDNFADNTTLKDTFMLRAGIGY